MRARGVIILPEVGVVRGLCRLHRQCRAHARHADDDHVHVLLAVFVEPLVPLQRLVC